MTKYLYNTLGPLYSLTDIYMYILVNLFVRASRTHSTEKQKNLLDKYAANCVPIN